MKPVKASSSCASTIPAGRTVSFAQIIWAWAKLERCNVPGDVPFNQLWVRLVDRYGLAAVHQAADTYDRDLYVGTGWEAAL